MALIYDHIFGTNNDSLTDWTSVTTSGTITENTTSVDLFSTADAWDSLGIYKTAAAFTNGATPTYVEMWFEVVGVTDNPNRMQIGATAAGGGLALGATTASCLAKNTTSNDSATMPNSNLYFRGVEPAAFTLASNTPYKFITKYTGSVDLVPYMDGGAYTDDALTVGAWTPFGATGIYPNASVFRLKVGTVLRLYAVYVQTDGLDYTPMVVNAGSDDSSVVDEYQLDATITYPVTGLTYSILWTQTVGPAPSSFDDDTTVDPLVTVTESGDYTYQCATTDEFGQVVSDTVTISFTIPDSGEDTEGEDALMVDILE